MKFMDGLILFRKLFSVGICQISKVYDFDSFESPSR